MMSYIHSNQNGSTEPSLQAVDDNKHPSNNNNSNTMSSSSSFSPSLMASISDRSSVSSFSLDDSSSVMRAGPDHCRHHCAQERVPVRTPCSSSTNGEKDNPEWWERMVALSEKADQDGILEESSLQANLAEQTAQAMGDALQEWQTILPLNSNSSINDDNASNMDDLENTDEDDLSFTEKSDDETASTVSFADQTYLTDFQDDDDRDESLSLSPSGIISHISCETEDDPDIQEALEESFDQVLKAEATAHKMQDALEELEKQALLRWWANATSKDALSSCSTASDLLSTSPLPRLLSVSPSPSSRSIVVKEQYQEVEDAVSTTASETDDDGSDDDGDMLHIGEDLVELEHDEFDNEVVNVHLEAQQQSSAVEMICYETDQMASAIEMIVQQQRLAEQCLLDDVQEKTFAAAVLEPDTATIVSAEHLVPELTLKPRRRLLQQQSRRRRRPMMWCAMKGILSVSMIAFLLAYNNNYSVIFEHACRINEAGVLFGTKLVSDTKQVAQLLRIQEFATYGWQATQAHAKGVVAEGWHTTQSLGHELVNEANVQLVHAKHLADVQLVLVERVAVESWQITEELVNEVIGEGQLLAQVVGNHLVSQIRRIQEFATHGWQATQAHIKDVVAEGWHTTQSLGHMLVKEANAQLVHVKNLADTQLVLAERVAVVSWQTTEELFNEVIVEGQHLAQAVGTKFVTGVTPYLQNVVIITWHLAQSTVGVLFPEVISFGESLPRDYHVDGLACPDESIPQMLL